MRKLAIVGTSNAVKLQGYAHILMDKFNVDCEIFSLGATSSILGVMHLLAEDIIGYYEYVLFDFTANETYYLRTETVNRNVLISYWMFIIYKFIDSKSKPIILILPYKSCPILESSSYIPRAISKLFDVMIIDMEKEFLFIENENYSDDVFHPYYDLQYYISRKIF